MLQTLFYLFLISVPFGYRVILHQWTLGFDEYESAFLYASDIFLLLFLLTYFLSLSKEYDLISKIKNYQFSIYNLQSILKSKLSLQIKDQEFQKDGIPRSQMSKILSLFCLKDIGLRQIGLFFFLFFSLVSILWATLPLLALYNFVRLVLLVFMALAISRLITKNYKPRRFQLKFIERFEAPTGASELLTSFFGILAGLAIVESLIGFLQFLFQHSLGLWWLGESLIGQRVIGSAKIIIEGGAVLRAYGTFPHPNVLGSFLILGLISLYYLWFKSGEAITPENHKSQITNHKQITNYKTQTTIAEGMQKEIKHTSLFGNWNSQFIWDLVLGICIFIVLLGIVLTFSRTAWLIAIIATVILITYNLLLTRRYLTQAVRLTFLLLVISFLLSVSFWSFISPRAQISSGDPAVSYRLSYNKLGINLIKEHPLGVGLGNQVIYSVKNNIYKDGGMSKVWEWQPIHNIYLLMASEIGIAGLIAFLIIIVTLFKFQITSTRLAEASARRAKLQINYKHQITNQKQEVCFGNSKEAHPIWNFKNWNLFGICNLEFGISSIMLLALLMFGMTDHFLWTLQPGRLMLWIVIGMVMATGACSSSHT